MKVSMWGHLEIASYCTWRRGIYCLIVCDTCKIRLRSFILSAWGPRTYYSRLAWLDVQQYIWWGDNGVDQQTGSSLLDLSTNVTSQAIVLNDGSSSDFRQGICMICQKAHPGRVETLTQKSVHSTTIGTWSISGRSFYLQTYMANVFHLL